MKLLLRNDIDNLIESFKQKKEVGFIAFRNALISHGAQVGTVKRENDYYVYHIYAAYSDEDEKKDTTSIVERVPKIKYFWGVKHAAYKKVAINIHNPLAFI